MPIDNAMTIGQLVDHLGVRDAIHVPIISVVAKENLQPGTPVQLDANLGAWKATNQGGFVAPAIGVVSPFLERQVLAGERFWVFIKPGSISTLTHQWTHRDIVNCVAETPKAEQAGLRLATFAETSLYISLAEMLQTIEDIQHGGDVLFNHGYEGLQVYKGFWADYELYTGKPDPTKKQKYFFFFTCGGCS